MNANGESAIDQINRSYRLTSSSERNQNDSECSATEVPMLLDQMTSLRDSRKSSLSPNQAYFVNSINRGYQ